MENPGEMQVANARKSAALILPVVAVNHALYPKLRSASKVFVRKKEATGSRVSPQTGKVTTVLRGNNLANKRFIHQ